jgi:AAA+ superfamily predicted ATPase
MDQSFDDELDLYLRARFTLMVLVTTEEDRALRLVRKVCDTARRPAVTWDLADGFQPLGGPTVAIAPARDPLTAMEQVYQAAGEVLFVFRDFHDCWGNAQVKRKLRTLAQFLKRTEKSILITTPTGKVPDELKNEAVLVEFLPPRPAELEAVLADLSRVPGVKVNLTPPGREKLIQAALGLTAAQTERVFAKAIVEDGVLDDHDIPLVTREKKQIIRESGALEFYAVAETIADVGGLGVLKEWLKLRERAFTHEAQEYGLPAPKGMALIGIPGTGKSLTAKMVGGLWQLPLLRLDLGALFGSLVGESEERVRRALRLAETVAPCVLWIDEVEKGLGGGGDRDGGTSSRVFGTILTWMQEKTAACFVVATANDIARLPPELLRKGRFDEIFFLDLPTLEERKEIFSVHLKKRRRDSKGFDVARLAGASQGYVGSEIEQAILDAMYVGFNARREFTTDDVLRALKRQVPLSVSQRERVEMLRDWLREGRAQSASFAEAGEAERQFVPLQPPDGTEGRGER